MTTRKAWLLGVCVMTPWLAWSEGAQSVDIVPAVSLEPEIRCWAHGEHSTVFAAIEPEAPITRIYFLYPMGPGSASGLVTLDFTSTQGLVPGSLRVLEGDVAALGARTVVVRLVAPARLDYVLEQ